MDGRIAEIRGLLEQGGADRYYGEDVSQLDHALQSAKLAEEAGAPVSLVVASLLHDVGHLLTGLPEDMGTWGVDGRHEAVGESWLKRFFGADVTFPVRHHVDAKRWLCAREPGYYESLSASSRRSLDLQGGPMDEAEVSTFERLPAWHEAVSLRRFDDAAKVTGRVVPGFDYYAVMIAACLKEPA